MMVSRQMDRRRVRSGNLDFKKIIIVSPITAIAFKQICSAERRAHSDIKKTYCPGLKTFLLVAILTGAMFSESAPTELTRSDTLPLPR